MRATNEHVKIGLSAPLTGDWAEYGNDFKRSVTMVIDQINREDGINGKKRELVIAESTTTGASTPTNAS